MRRLFYFYFLSCLCLTACQSPSSEASTSQPNALYFPVSEYFEQVMMQYQERSMPLTKKLMYGDTTETQVMDTMGLRRDLQLFAANDINRPAWSDAYRADTSWNENQQLLKTTYTALKEDLRTRRITVDWDGDAVTKVEIQTELKTLIADQQRVLTYWPDSAYHIQHEQSGRGLSTLAYLARVEL